MKKNRVNYSQIYKLFVAIIFLGIIIFSRGSIFGNIALKISLLCSVISVLLSIKGGRINQKWFRVYIFCLAFFLYCFIQGMILNDSLRYPTIIENTIYWISTCTAALFVCSDKKQEKIVGKVLLFVLSAFTISYFITFALSFFVPLNALLITTIDYGYFYNTPVYLPFTLVYGTGKIMGIEFLRMQGFGRECGITQTFYIWGFYKCQDYYKNSKTIKLLMGLGVLICFSTTGLVIFAVSFIIDFIIRNRGDKSNKKKYITILLLIIFVLTCGGTFSLTKRMDLSYADRMKNITNGFSLLRKYPLFGIGYMKSLSVSPQASDLSDICLLSSAGKIGIVGLLLFFAIYLNGLYLSTNKKEFILCNIGFLVTTVFAQPLYYVPLIYIMMFMNYYGKENNRKLAFRNNA